MVPTPDQNGTVYASAPGTTLVDAGPSGTPTAVAGASPESGPVAPQLACQLSVSRASHERAHGNAKNVINVRWTDAPPAPPAAAGRAAARRGLGLAAPRHAIDLSAAVRSSASPTATISHWTKVSLSDEF